MNRRRTKRWIFWRNVGVWVFLVLFAFTVVGAGFAVLTTSGSH